MHRKNGANVMDSNGADRQSQAVYLVLVVLGILLAIVGWVRWIF